MFVSLFFTYQTQYRKFTAAYDPIFMYQILEDDGPTQTLFDNYDSFFDITFLVKGKQSP